MKKIFTLLVAFALINGVQLQAQETGGGAASSSYAGSSNGWPEVAFVSGALAAVAAGLIVIAVNGNHGQITAPAQAHSH